ncbi:hypothetical protein FBQ81_16185 [Chloroflexi bacterium CFX6]|nr:hypothetical protein [Chloroflexi bacterium CFX6]
MCAICPTPAPVPAIRRRSSANGGGPAQGSITC